MYKRSCLHETFWKAHTWSVKLLITHFSGSSTNSTLRAVFSVDSMKCGLKGSVAWFSNSVCIVFGNIISAQGSGEEKAILFFFFKCLGFVDARNRPKPQCHFWHPEVRKAQVLLSHSKNETPLLPCSLAPAYRLNALCRRRWSTTQKLNNSNFMINQHLMKSNMFRGIMSKKRPLFFLHLPFASLITSFLYLLLPALGSKLSLCLPFSVCSLNLYWLMFFPFYSELFSCFFHVFPVSYSFILNLGLPCSYFYNSTSISRLLPT